MAGDHQAQRSQRRAAVLVFAALATMVGAWILAVPRSAGPDEPSHSVRAAALVRGELDGELRFGALFPRVFELPAHIGSPPPDCFAFQSFTPASCAADLEIPEGTAELGTRSADYPIWGHLLPGLGTLAPGSIAAWSARAFDALLPIAIIAAALLVASRRGVLGVGVTLLATTPMAWFMYAVVNPSGLSIAGGVGVWTALSALSAHSAHSGSTGHARSEGPDRLVTWLAALSWAALVLPRRDGLVWGALILSLSLVLMDIRLGDLRRRLGTPPLVVIGAATAATLAWASQSDTNDVRALFLTPLAPAAVVVGQRLWTRLATQSIAIRSAAFAGAGLLGLIVMLVVMGQRTNGFDREVLRLVIGYTGSNLTQAIGLLGWLDTPVPVVAIYLSVAALGALAGAAVLVGDRTIAVGMGAIVAVAVLAAWTLTMLQNDDTGTYWQGRYYLPLLAGAPILAGRLRLDAAGAARLGTVTSGAALVVANVALAATMRRFAVGVAGTLLPWEWDTYGAPLPPVLLLAAHIAASVWIVTWARSTTSSPSVSDTHGDAPTGTVSR